MTKPTADWYDDPEDPLQYRYWDGDQWTEHHAPKVVPRTPGAASSSAWSMFANTFRLAASRWREAVVLALPLVFAQLVGGWLLYRGLDRVFFGRLVEIIERFLEPGFDPTTGADKEFLDSIDVHLPSSAAWQIAIGAAISLLVTVVISLALSRLYVGANNGVELSPSEAIQAAVKRTPRTIAYGLMVVVAWVVVTFVVFLIGALVPALLVLGIPALIALGVWLLPFASIFGTALAAAPADAKPIPIAVTAMRGRWWWVFRRWLVLMLVLIVAGIGPAVVGNVTIYFSVAAYIVVSVINQSIQSTISAAGNAELYRLTGAEIDPVLINSDPNDTAPESPH